jgi:hypothetical protein
VSSENRDERRLPPTQDSAHLLLCSKWKKEVALAESQIETEELRCQRGLNGAFLQHQNCGSSI